MNAKTPSSVAATPIKFLLDVNALLAGVWGHHSRHTEAFTWLKGKSIVLCPLAELGFLRISSHKKAINGKRQGMATKGIAQRRHGGA